MTQLMRISILSIGMIAAARAVPDAQTPTPTGTPRRPGCRVYPTSVTDTTTDSTGGRTILTYTARFDPKTFETTQDVTYSSTQGSRFTYRQRTIYASLMDFIREGSLAPPFPLYRSTVQTGGINMTVQVTYDQSEHQLQTVTSQAAGQQTITNTAWDKAGRPTAGTITGPSKYASTFTYSYDDKQRTQTHTVVTGPQTMVMTTTFDTDANPISRMTRAGNQPSTTTIEIHARETQCLAGQPPPSPAGTGALSPASRAMDRSPRTLADGVSRQPSA